MPPRIVSVVLNTNRRDDTLACLESLARLDYPNRAVLVLDNASTDGSAAAIAAAHPDVRVLPLTENRGYAGNNNVGIAAALPRDCGRHVSQSFNAVASVVTNSEQLR